MNLRVSTRHHHQYAVVVGAVIEFVITLMILLVSSLFDCPQHSLVFSDYRTDCLHHSLRTVHYPTVMGNVFWNSADFCSGHYQLSTSFPLLCQAYTFDVTSWRPRRTFHSQRRPATVEATNRCSRLQAWLSWSYWASYAASWEPYTPTFTSQGLTRGLIEHASTWNNSHWRTATGKQECTHTCFYSGSHDDKIIIFR